MIWEDFTSKGKRYDDLDYLTWQNLGNRCGVRYGDQPRERVRTIYEIAVRLYEKSQQQTPTSEIRLPEEIPEGAIYSEGCVQQILINRYERDPHAREACIARFGTACFVCRLDLVSRYGQVIAGFIHVHHFQKLASVGANSKSIPSATCGRSAPDCHGVIHRRSRRIPSRRFKNLSGTWVMVELTSGLAAGNEWRPHVHQIRRPSTGMCSVPTGSTQT